MIRRLKSDVANDLPAKRRDKVYVDVTKDDMSAAWRHIGEQGRVNLEDDGVDCEGEPNSAGSIAKMQAIGLAKAAARANGSRISSASRPAATSARGIGGNSASTRISEGRTPTRSRRCPRL